MVTKVGAAFQPTDATLQANLAKQVTRNRELAQEATEAAAKRADATAANAENQRQIRELKARNDRLNAQERINDERVERRQDTSFAQQSVDAFAGKNSFASASERVGRNVDTQT